MAVARCQLQSLDLFWGFSGLRDFSDHMFHSHHKSRRGAMWCTRPQPTYISQFILPGFSELSQSKHLEMLQMMLFTACECLRINQAMFHHWLLIFDPLSHSHSANGNFWMTKTLKLPWQMSSEPNTGSFLLFSTSEHREVKNAEKESIWLTSEQAKFSLNFSFSLQGFSFRCCQVQDHFSAEKKTWKLVRASHPSKACL